MSNHESTILKPRDRALTNSDDWPIFALKNVLVFDPLDPTAEPRNLLHAGAYRPLTITGKLEPLSKQTSHLLLKASSHRTQAIELTNVKQYSYGQYEDGAVDIWAAGDAGWYTINPSRSYKHIYSDMVQAVQLLYFTADAYKEGKKKTADIDADSLFHKYCLEHPHLCTTSDDAGEIFARHRYFLLASMLDGKEGLQWTRTPFFKYLESTFPDDNAIIRQRRAFAMKPPKAPSSKRGTSSPAPSSASLKRKRVDRSGTPASLVNGRRKSRSASVATPTPSMTSSQGHALTTKPRSRRESTRLSQRSADDPVKEETKDSDADSDALGEGRRRHKGKSVLRPRPSKYVHERQQARPLSDASDADDDETDEAHGAVLMSPSSKRKMVDDLKPRRAKRRNNEMPSDAIMEDAMLSDADNDNDVDEDTVATPSEAYHDANEAIQDEQKPFLPFRFRDGKNGEDEGDVWRCNTDGCMHRVYAASEPASLILIDDHKRIHEYDEDQRVQLVRKMQAPWLPVGRLMGRVRELAAQSATPPPVVQRY